MDLSKSRKQIAVNLIIEQSKKKTLLDNETILNINSCRTKKRGETCFDEILSKMSKDEFKSVFEQYNYIRFIFYMYHLSEFIEPLDIAVASFAEKHFTQNKCRT